MATDRLAFLFDRYLSGTCTKEEKQELAAIVLSSEDEHLMQKHLQQAWENVKEDERMPEKTAADILNSILQQGTDMKEGRISGNGKVIKMVPWRRIAVAVSVLLMIGFSTYFIADKRSFQKQQIVKNDSLHPIVAPGGNKAILTLADGSEIILDSEENGLLKQQGNANILKLNDGELVYQKGNSGDSEITYNKITTPRGGQYQLTLADGSRVWLNAASSITFPTVFSGSEREVNITGEVYFEVAHNTKLPFRVMVNNMEVRVLGTRFNVNAYEEEEAIMTTLLEGSVKVSEGMESVLIKPGEQSTVFPDNGNNGKISVHKVDLEKVIAWKNGLFQFNDDRLEIILRQVSRWYNIDVECRNDKKNLRFNGVISRRSDVKDITDLLSATGVVKFKLEKGKLIAY